MTDELVGIVGRPEPADDQHPLTNATYNRGVGELREELQAQIDELRTQTRQHDDSADLAKIGLVVAVLALLVATASAALQFLT